MIILINSIEGVSVSLRCVITVGIHCNLQQPKLTTASVPPTNYNHLTPTFQTYRSVFNTPRRDFRVEYHFKLTQNFFFHDLNLMNRWYNIKQLSRFSLRLHFMSQRLKTSTCGFTGFGLLMLYSSSDNFVVFALHFVHKTNVYVVLNAVLKWDDNPKSPHLTFGIFIVISLQMSLFNAAFGDSVIQQ